MIDMIDRFSGTVQAASTGGVKAPYASGRDWAKIDKALAAEAEEKKVNERNRWIK